MSNQPQSSSSHQSRLIWQQPNYSPDLYIPQHPLSVPKFNSWQLPCILCLPFTISCQNSLKHSYLPTNTHCLLFCTLLFLHLSQAPFKFSFSCISLLDFSAETGSLTHFCFLPAGKICVGVELAVVKTAPIQAGESLTNSRQANDRVSPMTGGGYLQLKWMCPLFHQVSIS